MDESDDDDAELLSQLISSQQTAYEHSEPQSSQLDAAYAIIEAREQQSQLDAANRDKDPVRTANNAFWAARDDIPPTREAPPTSHYAGKIGTPLGTLLYDRVAGEREAVSRHGIVRMLVRHQNKNIG